VLIHVDNELGAKDLLNNRMAYVAVSRSPYDAQIFTNDREKQGAALGHDVSHNQPSSTLQNSHGPVSRVDDNQPQSGRLSCLLSGLLSISGPAAPIVTIVPR
jgi:hypothetical protein